MRYIESEEKHFQHLILGDVPSKPRVPMGDVDVGSAHFQGFPLGDVAHQTCLPMWDVGNASFYISLNFLLRPHLQDIHPKSRATRRRGTAFFRV